jgi:HAD superfamily hydrolase (TIGR01509 family)
VTRDEVAHAKPDPDLFLAAAQRLGVAIGESIVVGDSVWDLDEVGIRADDREEG